MSTSPESPADDCGLLLGVLALQLDFVGSADLQNALDDWAADRSRPFADLLVDRGLLAARRLALLEGLTREYLLQHDNDLKNALTAACAARTLPVNLDVAISPAMRRNPGTLPSAPGTLAGPIETTDAAVGLATSGDRRYRILCPHARGALGVVYLAHDEELHREVALKEIQDPYHRSHDSRHRFLLEAEITGLLEHPGIVPVYSLGHHADGRPYYVMRFIRGESLHDAITRFHEDDGPERNADERAFAQRALLRRFTDVCNAVAYAHSRGVVHRDLKPANVMLGPFGETLVVDWGLAKVVGRPGTDGSSELPVHPVTASAQTTMFGQVVGTPAFMAPEQAAGRIDEVGPASDVYSLGAMLYHLLAGGPPFPGFDPNAVIAQVLARAFLPPRQIKRTVPAALEAVVLKAMEARPEERYASAAELAQDVERYLADEPVSAYEEPAWEQTQRWARRHRTLVSGFFVLLLTAAVGLGAGLYFVGKERNQAQRNLSRAKEAVDECFAVATENPALRTDRNQGVRKLLLRKALPFYEGFESQRPDDRDVQEGLGLIRFRVAFITDEIGRKKDALSNYEKARQLYAGLAARYPDEERYRIDLAIICNNLGNLQSEAGLRELAHESYEQARRLREKLAEDKKEEPERRAALARTITNLGVFYHHGGQSKEAGQAFARAEQIQKELVAGQPSADSVASRIDLAATYNDLGLFLVDENDRDGAAAAYQKSRQLREELAKGEKDSKDSGRRRADLADVLINQGWLFARMGRHDDARAGYETARDTFEVLARDFADVVEYQAGLANALRNLGELEGELNHHTEAIKQYKKAEPIQKRLFEGNPEVVRYKRGLASTRSKLGDEQRHARQYDEALDSYARSLELRAGAVEERVAHEGRARALDSLKRPREAVAAWDEVLARADGDRFDPRVRRASSLAKAGDHAAAMAELEDLEKGITTQGDRWYQAACVAALASASARRAGEADAAGRYAVSAVRLLGLAWKAKLFADAVYAAHLSEDDDLEALKGRADYEDFLKKVKMMPGG